MLLLKKKTCVSVSPTHYHGIKYALTLWLLCNSSSTIEMVKLPFLLSKYDPLFLLLDFSDLALSSLSANTCFVHDLAFRKINPLHIIIQTLLKLMAIFTTETQNHFQHQELHINGNFVSVNKSNVNSNKKSHIPY